MLLGVLENVLQKLPSPLTSVDMYLEIQRPKENHPTEKKSKKYLSC